MKVRHAIFHRRLIWANLVNALLIQRAASSSHKPANFIILNRGLVIGSLLRFNELALKQRYVFRIIKFDDIGAEFRCHWQ